MIREQNEMNDAWATFSEDKLHRYELGRSWEYMLDRTLLVIGLNPSTATATEDDATIRKEIGFAKRWNCSRLVKVNAFSRRSTDPRMLYQRRGVRRAGWESITDLENDTAIARERLLVRATGGITLVAWGANISKIDPKRQAALCELLTAEMGDLMCLGSNQDGTPVHPLYQPYERERTRWMPRR